MTRLSLALSAASIALLVGTNLHAEDLPRVQSGLQALYTFDEGRGDIIRDQANVEQPLDLRIERPSAVQWRDGALHIQASTIIRSSRPAKRITGAVRRSGAVTIEAWIKPLSTKQSGPARIVSLSANSNERNFTLGQEGSRYDVRLRTTVTSKNGIPSLEGKPDSAGRAVTHVVYTRDRSGNARLYVNGKRQVAKKIAGKLTRWSDRFHLSLANELNGDRPWLGEFHLAAIYSRSLSPDEVRQNFNAGPHNALIDEQQLAEHRNAQLFETKIAPLLANNCLDCHDSATKKGDLDLSRRNAAFMGGESGIVIIPGQSDESLLWDQVESGDMPPEGQPLPAEDQALLREWIDGGAAWSLRMIDPAMYAHGASVGKNWVRRLTVPEYIETVRSAVGVDISKEARELLPPDLRADGFSNTAYNLNVDLKHVEAYSKLAETIVGRMDVLRFTRRFSKSQSLSTDNTMRKLVGEMGKWLLRGPLDDREVSNFSGIATTVASTGGDFETAVTYIIEAMLQSPRFIYRMEQQRGDGRQWTVSDYELASRISYIVWGGPPDAQLMRAADDGVLHDREQLDAQVRRMLDDPRAVDHSLRFISEWLNLNQLSSLQPNAKRFPQWKPALAADMRQETLAFFQDLVWQQRRPLADLLNAQFTYATPRLAQHYGLKVKAEDSGLSRYDLSKVPPRGGLLTQGSVLTVGGDDASMVTRGLFVLHDLLRGSVKDPPPGLDTTPVPSKPGLSQRGISEQRISNNSCGGCHKKFEPLAFGLERFDGVGAYREQDEHGNSLREDGALLVPGEAESVTYQTSAELMDLLAGADRVRETITWKLTQFALGRPLASGDVPELEKIHLSAEKAGGTYENLITAIVMSDLVRMTRTEVD